MVGIFCLPKKEKKKKLEAGLTLYSRYSTSKPINCGTVVAFNSTHRDKCIFVIEHFFVTASFVIGSGGHYFEWLCKATLPTTLASHGDRQSNPFKRYSPSDSPQSTDSLSKTNLATDNELAHNGCSG